MVEPALTLSTEVVRGVALEVVEAGHGATTVVVTPGFGSGISGYELLIEQLAREHHVVGFSPGGFGRSEWMSPYSIRDWVEDLVGIVGARANGPVVAVGHSFGALLSLGAAAEEPSRFSAVISLDQIVEVEVFVPLAKQLCSYWQQVRRAVKDAGGDPEVLSGLLADVVAVDGRLGDNRSQSELSDLAFRWITQDPDVLAALTDAQVDRWMADPVLADLPNRVRCPVLFVDGDPEAGSMVSAEQGHRHLAAFPLSDQVRIGGVGHALGIERSPGPVVAAIAALLSGFSRSLQRD